MSKHGVSFQDAAQVFFDPRAVTIPDPDHSWDEERSVTVGRAKGEILVTVIHTDRQGRIRVISARPADRWEREFYEGR